MATLRTQHPITDYATWRRAFDSFAAARDRAGVEQHRPLRRPTAAGSLAGLAD